MKFAVVGPGGVGGYFGARLQGAGHEVHFVGRPGSHLEALRTKGLRLESLLGDLELTVSATSETDEVGPVAAVLVAVKSQHTADVLPAIVPLIGAETVVVSLQNGLGNEELLADAVGEGRVLGGLVYLLATIDEPGLVRHIAGPATLIFGEMGGGSSERGRALLTAFGSAGIEATLSEDIRSDLWSKFAFICAASGVTALSRLTMGEIRAEPEAFGVYRALLDEAAAVARAEGAALSEERLAGHVQFALDTEPGLRSSLHHDISLGKPTELESLQGELVRRARRAAVSSAGGRDRLRAAQAAGARARCRRLGLSLAE